MSLFMCETVTQEELPLEWVSYDVQVTCQLFNLNSWKKLGKSVSAEPRETKDMSLYVWEVRWWPALSAALTHDCRCAGSPCWYETALGLQLLWFLLRFWLPSKVHSDLCNNEQHLLLSQLWKNYCAENHLKQFCVILDWEKMWNRKIHELAVVSITF